MSKFRYLKTSPLSQIRSDRLENDLVWMLRRRHYVTVLRMLAGLKPAFPTTPIKSKCSLSLAELRTVYGKKRIHSLARYIK